MTRKIKFVIIFSLFASTKTKLRGAGIVLGPILSNLSHVAKRIKIKWINIDNFKTTNFKDEYL